ncbi:MAG: hypothetical protein JNK65_00255, partial [Deltaproteobacteria bacterium]|nr:hypothetical protein [Deltaproteobacteria bacterium]
MKQNKTIKKGALLIASLVLLNHSIADAKTPQRHVRKGKSPQVTTQDSALRNRIDSLEQNQKILERKLELEKEQAQEKNKDNAIVT